MADSDLNRRPTAARGSGLAQHSAAALARTAITPNQISMASIVFAGIGTAALVWWPTWEGLVLCAVCVQLRLLCNLLDGMVAVEGGKGSIFSRIYNEFPDRLTDTLFIVALGYACGMPWLGWLGALLAVATAYVRVFGGSLGLAQDFRRPLIEALHRGESLTIFPEGTRRAQALPSAFKSGLFHLATRFTDAELIPVYLDNLYRSMPKGTWLPVPLTCSVRFGAPLERRADEAKDVFLERARTATVEFA